MTVYSISFRVGDVKTPNGTYESRYTSIQEAILANANEWWDEPTSYYVITSDADNSANLANLIDSQSSFDPTVDIIIVVNLTHKGYKVLGKYADKDIDKIMKLR